MSGRTWLYSDPHFYQKTICEFKRPDGTKLRPWDTTEEMSEWMITEYNKLVSDIDRVYILGDIAMGRKALDKSLPFLKGRKVLVKGNHDEDKLSYYSQYFDDIRAYVIKKGFILSHIPIHPSSVKRFGVNIHGHLHSNSVELDNQPGIKDPRYFCVCVEQTDFKPILLDEVLKRANIDQTIYQKGN